MALIQTSLPDGHGNLSLGVSLDIVKAAVENASYVIAQVNDYMPRVHGDSFIHIDNIDFLLPHDEPLLIYNPKSKLEITHRIGNNIARLVEDGDTIQVGYGAVTNAILENLSGKSILVYILSSSISQSYCRTNEKRCYRQYKENYKPREICGDILYGA